MHLSKRKKRSRFSNLLFVLPIVAAALLVIFAVFETELPRTGTLVVEAQGSSNPPTLLHVTVTVDGQRGVTPFNLTLPDGYYSVDFPAVSYYSTPAAEKITLPARVTAYAVGRYVPIPVVISISGGRFNDTNVKALHGVTPVVWVNHMNSITVLTGTAFSNVSPVSRVGLAPGQNFTYVFPSTGSYSFQLYNLNSSGLVDVV